MSSNGGVVARPCQGSRRATMAPGLIAAGMRSGLSVSPQKALRTRVLREREGNVSADGSIGSVGGPNAGVAKVGTKLAASNRPVVKTSTKSQNQRIQFAFGSKIIKPKQGTVSTGHSVIAGEGRALGSTRASIGSVAADPAALPTGRRNRSNSGHESLVARGRQTPEAEQQRLTSAAAREVPDAEFSSLKKQLEDREATIALLRSQLEKRDVAGRSVTTGRSGSEAGVSPSGEHVEHKYVQQRSDVEEVALQHVAEEARRETEETILKIEEIAATGISRTMEMQASVDEIIRKLKASH